MKIKTVLFDLDDTLVVDEAVSKDAFQRVAELATKSYGADPARFALDAARHARALWSAGPSQPYCKSIGISAFECLWGRFEGDSAELTQLREWSLRYREQVFDAALRDQLIESPAGAHDLAEAFSAERRRLQRLMPDAKETLARLAADYCIGLLTNGAPDLQREKIAASGLGSFFQAIAVSGEHGIGKPKPEIFQRLLAELSTKPCEAVMVGNSLERDILGAKNAEIFSVWLKVPGSEEHASVEPDRMITALAELPGLLKSLPSGVAA
jgi:putative hydrolase of the HAD superfamily